MDPKETQKAPPNPEEETQEAPWDPGVEMNDVAGLAEESTNLEGPVVPARRKVTISGNRLANNGIVHVQSTGAWKEQNRKRFLPTNEKGDEDSVSMCDHGGTRIFQRKVELPEPIARGMSPEQ